MWPCGHVFLCLRRRFCDFLNQFSHSCWELREGLLQDICEVSKELQAGAKTSAVAFWMFVSFPPLPPLSPGGGGIGFCWPHSLHGLGVRGLVEKP